QYSQSKLELYGLFQVLNATKLWIISANKLVIKVDTQYIKGMLNKPDIYPNAAMNYWISAILMFDFELKHVPGVKHKGPDGLSRRQIAEDEGEQGREGVDEAENWVDEVLGCSVWVAGSLTGNEAWVMAAVSVGSDKDVTSERKGKKDKLEGFDGFLEVWNKDERVKAKKKKLKEIRTFLEMMKLPERLTNKTKQAFLQHASKFFM
ncbi:hypothetical protein AN958_10463, partial [Leucoagaricus sp. SymC.cos]